MANRVQREVNEGKNRPETTTTLQRLQLYLQSNGRLATITAAEQWESRTTFQYTLQGNSIVKRAVVLTHVSMPQLGEIIRPRWQPHDLPPPCLWFLKWVRSSCACKGNHFLLKKNNRNW